MKTSRLVLATMLLALTVTASTLTQAQAPQPQPSSLPHDHGVSENGQPLASPPAVAETTLDGKAITIHYNTPSMRGRKIFGGLLPYDHWWRTGANPATSFVTAIDLKIGTLDVPAGSYTLYTIPEAAPSSWILIISKQTGQWGTVYKPEMDLGRTEMKEKALPSPQELMSLSFEDVHTKTADLHIKWETTDAYVKITAK